MIPSGLTDNNLEFFSLNGELYSLSNGIRYQFPKCPSDHARFLQIQLDADTIARETLTNIPDDQKLKVYGICRFGACNSTPDGVDNNCIDKTEYFDCGIRGRCEYEGKRCKELVTDAGVISSRQLQIMILVSRGMLSKEIANQLNISENTVANHLANIHQKIGGRTRVDIATFVKERDIA